MRSEKTEGPVNAVRQKLRELLDRPLAEQGPALLAGLAALLVLGAIAAVAGALGGDEERGVVNRPPPPVVGGPVEPQHGGEAELTDAEQTARAFLDEYLPFAYGQGPLPTAGATPELRERLRREYASGGARVPPTKRELAPELTRLDLSGSDPTKLEATAAVDDGGGSPYDFELTVERRRGVWQVTRLGGE